MARLRKLTEQQERRIRRLVNLRRKLTNIELAKRYNVSSSLIGDIAQGSDFRLKTKMAKVGLRVTSTEQPE